MLTNTKPGNKQQDGTTVTTTSLSSGAILIDEDIQAVREHLAKADLVKATEKAIRDAGLGLNPQVDGQTVRVPIPALDEERRVDLTRVAGKYAEQAKVSVRNVRRDGMDSLKKMEKDGDISQDEQRGNSDDIQELTDAEVGKIDEMLEAKQAEIMQV